MGLEGDVDDQLFLLETVIESATLRLDHDEECDDQQEDPPWTISFQLCNTFSFEITQENEEKTEEILCPSTKDVTVQFHSGKSCLFTANPCKFLEVIQSNPICVTVSAKYCDSPTPEVLARGEIEFDEEMIEELCTCLKEDSNNSETSCKGCYPLCDSKQLQVGVIKLYMRLSFYGKCILSEFKLLSGMDNILFKVQNENERNKCFKCGKAKKAAESEDTENDECADDDQSWGDTGGYQSKYLPRASTFNYDKDLYRCEKGNEDSGFKSCLTKNYSDDLNNSDDLFTKDFPRQSYRSSCRDQEKGLYSSFDSSRAFSLNKKASCESVDFRKIIGEEKLNYQSSDESKSYIAPMFDYCDEGYAAQELKVKRAPTMIAGPKRRRKPKAKGKAKTKNFEAPGVNVGHKECVKKPKKLPKRSGWTWPEKSKKDPHWKPGSVPRNIAEILNSSRLDPEGGKGDFTRKSPSKREMKTDVLDQPVDKADEPSRALSTQSRSNTVAEGDDQPSLHFKMCGGSYMISVNPAALGDKSKDRRNQNGLFMRLNRKEQDLESNPSDLEIAFTTPRLKGDPCVPVKLTESQFIQENASNICGELTSSRNEGEGGISANVIGGSGNENALIGKVNQMKMDDRGNQCASKDQDPKKRNAKNENLQNIPSQGDTPKLISWEENPDTAVSQYRKTARKLVF
ncbi:uncharacterized protein LOC124167494 [Ischnura elegans]|uniref:uncharacterized protein LOC124167494 n=1 Tax=Ischnura elegans TaxID=197161 RepID=UPI001ED89A54|nr:uncharacterized protein LOC124167494 [Ischnura elegans]